MTYLCDRRQYVEVCSAKSEVLSFTGFRYWAIVVIYTGNIALNNMGMYTDDTLVLSSAANVELAA